jgi:hypothetical protein
MIISSEKMLTYLYTDVDLTCDQHFVDPLNEDCDIAVF